MHLFAAVLASAIAAGITDGVPPGPPVGSTGATICLIVSPALALDARGRAIAIGEANAIWQSNGAAVRQTAARDEGCDRLILVKSDREARPEDMSRDAALAWVPFVDGRARQLIFLRVSRIRALVAGIDPGPRPDGLTDLLIAKLVGRSLAHELGHVLLNVRDHEATGLMRARYRAADLLRVPLDAYTLTASQRARLFAHSDGGLLAAQ